MKKLLTILLFNFIIFESLNAEVFELKNCSTPKIKSVIKRNLTIDTSQNTIKDYVVTDKNGTFNEVRQLQNSNGGIFKSNLYETSFHKGYKWQLEIDTNSSSFYISRYKARNGKFEGNGPTYNCDQVVSSQQKKVEIASMIEKAKSTCKSLGFKEGSQQFADCSLKLYTQSVELAA